MARIAVCVDLGFFLARYRVLRLKPGQELSADEVARAVWSTARAHVEHDDDELYRILVYDCRPINRRVHNPISGKFIDFSRTTLFAFRTQLHEQLLRKRKLALRFGELAASGQWLIREKATKALLSRKIHFSQLTEHDVQYDVRQKGVDLKMGIDIASIALKGQADRIVLITGDADFVPAAKLARREGIDVVLDPLWAPISPSLNEHIDGLQTTWPRQSR